MKNLNSIFAAIIFAFFALFALTSCQKEAVTEMEGYTKEETQQTKSPVAYDLKKVNKTEVINLETADKATNQAQARSGRRLIYSAQGQVNQGGFRDYTLNNPKSGVIYTVELTPLSGDPDLYIYSDRFREIRKSETFNLNTETSYFEADDLFAGERGGIFSAYGFVDATFAIDIYEEASQSVTIDNMRGLTYGYRNNPSEMGLTGNGWLVATTDGDLDTYKETHRTASSLTMEYVTAHAVVGRTETITKTITINLQQQKVVSKVTTRVDTDATTSFSTYTKTESIIDLF